MFPTNCLYCEPVCLTQFLMTQGMNSTSKLGCGLVHFADADCLLVGLSVCVCVYICLCWYTSLGFGDGCAVVSGRKFGVCMVWIHILPQIHILNTSTPAIVMCIFPRKVRFYTEQGGVVKTIEWKRKHTSKWVFSVCGIQVFPLATGVSWGVFNLCMVHRSLTEYCGYCISPLLVTSSTDITYVYEGPWLIGYKVIPQRS